MGGRPAPSYANVRNNTASSWWNDPGLRASMTHIFVLYAALYTLGYDAVLLNGLQAIAPWQTHFGHPTGTKLGLISASFYLPKVILAWVAPYINDRFGRRIPLFLAVTFAIAGSILGGLCNTTAQLVGGRILVGAGTSFGSIGAVTLVPELAHPRLRHQAGSFLWTTFFIGSIVAAWCTFGMTYYPDPKSNNAWRIPLFLQGVGPVILGVGLFFVPQSPRWLIAHGREEEGHAILAKYHANGDMEDELVLLELREIKAGIAVDRSTQSGGWSDWLTKESMRRRLGVIVLIGVANQCCGNGIVNYYLVPILKQIGISKPPQTAGINGGLSIWSWFCAMIGASLVERVGRRKLFLWSWAAMFFVFVIITGLAGSYATTKIASHGIAVIPMLFLFQTSYSMAETPVPPLYIPEIAPLAMRTKAVGILSFTQSAAGVFNQFVNPIALAAITWKYYAVYAAACAVYFVLYYFFVKETRGLTVEEAAMVYEPAETREAAIEEERRLRSLADFEASEKMDDDERIKV